MNRMPRLRLVLCSLSVAALLLSPLSLPAETVRNIPSADVYFSPRGGATKAVVAEIDGARSEILLQAYSFTSAPIARALTAAHRRGVKVMAVLDRSQRGKGYSSASFLANAGIPVYIDARHAIAHSKILVIDREVVITGSFNFTKAAEEKNAENLQVIRSRDMARVYIENFDHHVAHSERYRQAR